jgi:hypothetical protein
MKAAGLMLLGVAVTLCFWVSKAQALPEFKKAFQEKYVDSSDNPDFKAAFKEASCNVCHVKGDRNKKHRNEYGKLLAKYTGGSVVKDRNAAEASGGDSAKKDVMDKALKALAEGFDKVADEKSSSGDTYGERIKAGKLPAP